jgi:hypothetical protein
MEQEPVLLLPEPHAKPIWYKPVFLLTILTTLSLFVYASWTYLAPHTEEPITIAEVATGNTVLGFDPSSIVGNIGETKVVDLIVNSGSEHLLGAQVVLSYDPANLEITQVALGTHLATQVLQPTIDAATGTVTFTSFAAINSTNPAESGVAGQGTLATITFKIKAAGTLAVADSTQTTVREQEDNSFGSATPVAITLPAASADPSTSPSTSPSVSPSASPSTSPATSPSPTASSKTTLKTKYEPTCTNITYTWDKLAGAKGYVVDISKTSNFQEVTSSGQLGSDVSETTFNNLSGDTTYYARITQAGIHDYPQYSGTLTAKTKNCNLQVNNATPTPTKTTQVATPKPTVKPTSTPKTTPRPSQVAQATTSPSATTVTTVGDSFGDLGTETYIPEPETTTQEQPMSFLEWLVFHIRRIIIGQ